MTKLVTNFLRWKIATQAKNKDRFYHLVLASCGRCFVGNVYSLWNPWPVGAFTSYLWLLVAVRRFDCGIHNLGREGLEE